MKYFFIGLGLSIPLAVSTVIIQRVMTPTYSLASKDVILFKRIKGIEQCQELSKLYKEPTICIEE